MGLSTSDRKAVLSQWIKPSSDTEQDQQARAERMVREASDPEVAVILFDVVLGYGSHPDPAAEMAPAIAAARAAAAKRKRRIAFVGAVCGTDADPQPRDAQVRILAAAGVRVFESNAEAAEAAIGALGT